MMENDDKLLKQFFADNRQEIADNGFTRRVMHRLPCRSHRLAQWWTAFCFTLAVVLFVALDGIRLIGHALYETLATMVRNGAVEQIDLKSLIIAGIVLMYLGCRKISSLA